MIEILKASAEIVFSKSAKEAAAMIDFICDYREDDVIKQNTKYDLTNNEELASFQKALDIIKEHGDDMIGAGSMKISSESWLEELVKVAGIPRAICDDSTVRNILRIDISVSESILK